MAKEKTLMASFRDVMYWLLAKKRDERKTCQSHVCHSWACWSQFMPTFLFYYWVTGCLISGRRSLWCFLLTCGHHC